nr:reverse transcriptase domain-containing protein [Tanacetum cinerariifolium]
MRTRSNFYPFNFSTTIPRHSNRRRIQNIVEPEFRAIENIVTMAGRTMEELLQAPTEGYGEAIIIPEILAVNFEIKMNLLQLVQANKFHGQDRARIWYEKEPPNLILTWDDLVNKFVNQFFPPSKTTHLKKEISRFTQRFEETFSEAWYHFKELLRACPHHGFSESTQIGTFYNGLTEQDQDSLNAAAGDNLLNKTTREALKIIENKSKVRYSRNKSNVARVNTNSRDNVSKTDDRIDKLADQISNLVEIVNKQVVAPAKAVEKICVTCGGAHAYYECIATDNPSSIYAASGSYNQISPPNRASHQIPPPGFASVQNNSNRFNQGRGISSISQNQPSTSGTLPSNTIPNPKGEMKDVTTRSGLAYEGPSIPTESPLEKVDEQNTEEILDKEQSNSSGSTAQVQPLVVPISILELDVPRTKTKPTILKLGDPGKFLIPYDFPGMEVCHALADLGASINLMPLSIWKKLSLPELTHTRMTLELADRSITRPKRVAEDVFVKVGKFHFPTDFVVVEFEADLRVPLILGRSFLRTGRALIDVYGEEITLRVNDEFITFNLNRTMRYSLTYDDTSVNKVDVIDIACEELVQDVLDFQYNPKSSNPTLVFDDLISEIDARKVPIVKSSSPTLTPFGESDFFLEEIEDFLNDDSIPIGIENFVYDPGGDILFLKKLLNEDPFQLPLMDLKLVEESKEKSFVEEPPELELKELPSHLEYVFLEDSNKLPIFDIKGIDLTFGTHKILMEDDYKPAIQSQRRVIPKIHDVIKEEVIKHLDAGMIYPISDSLWVSPIHCVPKKGGMTVVANENNELILTRLVTSWRVCIDYTKLNDATRKDHFPLPFMDQILERLAWNEFYCFLDGFSGYFQIPIDPQDQEKTTFTCPYGTFAYRRMPFGLCNAPGHKISKSGIDVDRAKDFLKIVRPMTHLLEKETPFVFSKECIDAFNTLKKKLTKASILVVPDWNLPFELMCDASDYAIGVVLGKRKSKHFQPIHYASKTITEAQIHYTTTEKEMLAVVYAFENFRPYLVLSKSIVYTDHSALKYFLNKQDAKPRQSLAIMEPISAMINLPAFRTAYKTPIGCTPYKLVYEKSCHLPIELEHRAYWALKHVNFDLKTTGDHCKLQLNELSELRDQAYENSVTYKERMKKLHDSKIKNRIFNVGDQVLLFNSRLKIFSGKLKTRWSGPFTITRVFPYGTIELSQPNGPNFKVNGHRVKHYFGGDIPFNVAPDLHTLPKDN